MPPQKRSAAAEATTSTVKRKKVSIGETSVIEEPDSSETRTSARLKRSSTRTLMYHSQTAETPATKTANAEGRKSRSAAVTESATTGGGRPPTPTTRPREEQQSLGQPVGRPERSA